MATSIRTIALIGAGNVASYLAESLISNGISIVSVSSRSGKSAATLAQKIGSSPMEDISELPEADLVLLCVSDDAIGSVLEQIPPHLPAAYTSGTAALSNLPARKRLGVFYPLQTFSIDREINLFEVPFFIEANDPLFAQELFDLAWKLSRNVHFASSEDRRHLHLAAVLVNNFTNHLAFLAKSYLERHGLEWEYLHPLMRETFEKLDTKSPLEAQTGPARRNDQATIHEHISMLDGSLRDVYSALSRSILETYHKQTP